jgi:hypothetical protein
MFVTDFLRSRLKHSCVLGAGAGCLVKDQDISAITVQAKVEGDEQELPEGWDAIIV